MAFFKKDYSRFSFRNKKKDRTIQEQHAGLLKGAMQMPGYLMFINRGQDDEMEICCFKTSKIKIAFTRLVYGSNKITVKELSILKLLFLEVLNPFYIFQICSFILWFLDDYYYYAAAILAMSIFGISMTVRQTRKNQRKLKSTVHSSDVCTVLKRAPKQFGGDGDVGYEAESISTELLVPGDVLVIPSHGCVMHCDAILLTGNCILNESMLTDK
ncbi:E1-E2 ATPase domain containing protein [Asbolus verrucosus]|uniref:E1-E2 ATPase domain containing protein n=1 Tax=Asbolus verrucosus TaxID=1661398 RepID=A0A482V9G8_ASBVE|nr:E1-E2 ATPase domain containing protein [Asbolus verrucosus]